jgi:DNA-binding CsgD family transcriptional regulator
MHRASAWARSNGLIPTAVATALACGRRREAQRLTDDAERGIRGRDAPAATADIHLARGFLLQDTDPAAGAGHFESARRLWDRMNRPYDVARATEWHARALPRSDPEQIAQGLSRAMEIYCRLGATFDAARCRHVLRELGLARPSLPGRRGYGDRLSPREQDVARMLAEGATNREIAEALFLSPRTVEHHVARTLKKLGATRQGIHDVLVRRGS